MVRRRYGRSSLGCLVSMAFAAAVIKRRILAFADSIGLPEAARHVHVKRGQKMISIWAEYYDNIELPGIVREIHFNPQASGPF